MNAPPRLFVSYSWSTPEHEQWVLDFATELRESEVDVVLDKWDLKEGHDAIAFMERMVTDPTIKKVILICDRTYVAKADGRDGGVGTETQIISAEVYAKQAQDKFVAVTVERDDDGKPVRPAYYRSRIYVDFSESDKYDANFEKLLRWVFDKPLHKKPELGKAPSYIVDANFIHLGTSALARRVIDGIKTDKTYVRGALDEYLLTFSQNMERFRIHNGEEPQDEVVVKSIEDFIPARKEILDILVALVQYSDGGTYWVLIHRFFESLVPYLSRQSHNSDSDNFRFVVHELFLYTLAILLRAEHFESATGLLSRPFYLPGNLELGLETSANYTTLWTEIDSFEIRNKRLGLSRLSLRADLLEQRSKTSGVEFRHLMQADFVCFIRAVLAYTGGWKPETLLYATRQYGPFELFARAVSKTYLQRVLPLLGSTDLSTIKSAIEPLNDRGLRWGHQIVHPFALLGFKRLGKHD